MFVLEAKAIALTIAPVYPAMGIYQPYNYTKLC